MLVVLHLISSSEGKNQFIIPQAKLPHYGLYGHQKKPPQGNSGQFRLPGVSPPEVGSRYPLPYRKNAIPQMAMWMMEHEIIGVTVPFNQHRPPVGAWPSPRGGWLRSAV